MAGFQRLLFRESALLCCAGSLHFLCGAMSLCVAFMFAAKKLGRSYLLQALQSDLSYDTLLRIHDAPLTAALFNVAGASIAARDRRGRCVLDYAPDDSEVRSLLEGWLHKLEVVANQLQADLLASLEGPVVGAAGGTGAGAAKAGKKGKKAAKAGKAAAAGTAAGAKASAKGKASPGKAASADIDSSTKAQADGAADTATAAVDPAAAAAAPADEAASTAQEQALSLPHTPEKTAHQGAAGGGKKPKSIVVVAAGHGDSDTDEATVLPLPQLQQQQQQQSALPAAEGNDDQPALSDSAAVSPAVAETVEDEWHVVGHGAKRPTKKGSSAAHTAAAPPPPPPPQQQQHAAVASKPAAPAHKRHGSHSSGAGDHPRLSDGSAATDGSSSSMCGASRSAAADAAVPPPPPPPSGQHLSAAPAAAKAWQTALPAGSTAGFKAALMSHGLACAGADEPSHPSVASSAAPASGQAPTFAQALQGAGGRGTDQPPPPQQPLQQLSVTGGAALQPGRRPSDSPTHSRRRSSLHSSSHTARAITAAAGYDGVQAPQAASGSTAATSNAVPHQSPASLPDAQSTALQSHPASPAVTPVASAANLILEHSEDVHQRRSSTAGPRRLGTAHAAASDASTLVPPTASPAPQLAAVGGGDTEGALRAEVALLREDNLALRQAARSAEINHMQEVSNAHIFVFAKMLLHPPTNFRFVLSHLRHC